MSTTIPQIIFQPPLGGKLITYNRSVPANAQSLTGSQPFLDALTVREKVFVDEMRAIPLQHHTDTDDARSYHWILYSPFPSPQVSPQPIGTIRLVPSPHHPHPEPGARYEAPSPDVPILSAEEVFMAPAPAMIQDRATSLHDGVEPYLKLGRLCVVKEFRGRKFADILISTALDWAGKNAEILGKGERSEWRGLVCAHAQEKAVTMWARNGFVVDEGMGTWYEAGIRHFGMWRRVDLPSDSELSREAFI